jgi:hypothetical protein
MRLEGELVMKDTNYASFQSLDLGTTKPTSIPQEEVTVVISTENLTGKYGEAFVKECYRVNPLRAEQVELTAEEVQQYSHYLMTKRVESVQGNCQDFRKLKNLYIPSWIQYCLTMVGKLYKRDIGLVIIPEMESPSTMTFEEALVISDKIGAFEDDLQIVLDAMPRDDFGNADVMSTALIADYVRALAPVQHVASTYVTAFLGMKLKEEVMFQALYRVQYDDYGYVASALTASRGIY